MDRNLVAFLVCAVVILLAWNRWLTPPPRPPGASATATAEAGAGREPPPPRGSRAVREAGSSLPSAAPPVRARGAPVEVELENDLIRVRISSAGGRLTSVRLKRHRTAEKGEVELLHPWGASGGLELGLGDAALEEELNGALYRVERRAGEAAFLYRSASGLEVEKSFQVGGRGYLWGCSVKLTAGPAGLGDSDFRIRFGTQLPRRELESGELLELVTYTDKKVIDRMPTGGLFSCVGGQAKDVQGTHAGAVAWTGFKSKYFAGVMAPDFECGLISFSQIVSPQGLGEASRLYAGRAFVELFSPLHLAGGETVRLAASLYTGPVEAETLSRLGRDLDQVVDLGFFTAIGQVMVSVLKVLYRVTRDWGVSILILTILVRALLWYPTHRSMLAMRGMQKIAQPMQALQKRYKGDPKRLQQEMVKMYREQGVSPLSGMLGCLPMLMQMPVFIALYATLSSAIELRGAEFLWLSDLSRKDPFFVIPGLIGVSMWVQQKVATPPTMDPQQAKLMLWLMPAMMLFFFLSLPAGVGLYFIVSNLVSLAQQLLVNKISPLPVAAAAAAAKG